MHMWGEGTKEKQGRGGRKRVKPEGREGRAREEQHLESNAECSVALTKILLVNHFAVLFFLFLKPRDSQFCSNPYKVIYLNVLVSRKSTKWSQMVSSLPAPSISVICTSKGVMFMRFFLSPLSKEETCFLSSTHWLFWKYHSIKHQNIETEITFF